MNLMATKRKGKTVPCEGCRERKKKCSAGQPCERCKRLGIQCFYLKAVVPPKLEYTESINNQEIQLHVEVMEDIMRNMEREMYLLKSPFLIKQHALQVDSVYSDEEFDTKFHLDNSNKALLESNNHIATNWELKFGKDGGFTINTNIQSYTSLLKHIEALGTESKFCPIIKQPTLASLSAGGGYLQRNVLSSTLRKGNFKITLACIQNCQQRKTPLMIEPPFILFEQEKLCLKLINTYFSCRFLHRVIFHQKTFFDMFVNNYPDPESSPVVCALSAAVLTMNCKHIMNIVPYAEQMELGEYYFNKARQAISLQFDEANLETMIVYLHLAFYKSNLLRPQEANVYLDMAIRIRQILADDTYKDPPTFTTYNHTTTTTNNNTMNNNNNNNTTTTTSTTITNNTNNNNINNNTNNTNTPITIKKISKSKAQTRYTKEYETFKRLHGGFHDAIQFIQFVNNQRGVPVNNNKNKQPSMYSKQIPSFKKLFESVRDQRYSPQPMSDESRQTVRAIMKDRYINLMVKNIGHYFRRVRFGEDDMIPLSFLLSTEENLKQAYNFKIPLEYKLPESIFEDGISDVEFKKRLQEDGRCDVVSVAIASRYHQSLLALHEPFLPVIKRPPVIAELSLLQENIEAVVDTTKQKRKRKSNPSTSFVNSPNSSTSTLYSSSDNDTDEYDDTPVLSVHSLRAQEVCHRCAITVARLLEYQCMTLESCNIPVASLLSAWDILVRNSCLGMTLEDLEESGVSSYLSPNDIRMAREYAVRCIEVLRRGYIYNGAEREIWEYYERIEVQLLRALCTDASPTAKYWEPVSTWY